MAPRYRLPASALRNAATALQTRNPHELRYRMAELRTLGIMLTGEPEFRRRFANAANGRAITIEAAFAGVCACLDAVGAVVARR